VRGRKYLESSDFYIWCEVCSEKYRKEKLNIFTKYLVHRHIWLNLHKDDHHSGYKKVPEKDTTTVTGQ
jgi:hypothetical protein